MAEFHGVAFTPPTRINERRLGRLSELSVKAQAAERRGDDASASALLAEFKACLNGLVDMVLLPAEAERFDALCDEHGATSEDLQEFIGAQLQEYAGRPTSRSSDSSAGPQNTPARSEVGSSSQDESQSAQASLEAQGRPDLALVVMQTREARSA